MNRVILQAIVLVHSSVIVTNAIAFFVLPFATEWYVYIPTMSSILFLTLARGIECPLTRLENYYRRKIGMNRIGGFVGHYFIRALRKKHG